MTAIPMKSKGAVDHGSLSTINNIKVQGTLSAQNITTLNKSSTGSQTQSRTPASLGSQTQSRTLAHSGSQRQSSRTPTFSGSQAQSSRTPTFSGSQAQSSRTPAYSGSQAQSSRTPAYSGSQAQSGRTPAYSGSQTQSRTPAYSGPQRQSRSPAQPSAHVQAPPAALPLQMQLPPLQKAVQKGQKVPLSSGAPIRQLTACFGWNTNNAQCDVDVSAFLLGADGKVLGDSWFVFYGQTESPDQSCRFQAQSTQDRETISIDFSRLHSNVKKIVFVLTINEAFEKKLHFGMMKDAYVRILGSDRTELVSFKMTDYYSNVISMMIGEIYDYNGTWKFHAVGNGVAKDLAGLCALYGVQVSD